MQITSSVVDQAWNLLMNEHDLQVVMSQHKEMHWYWQGDVMQVSS